MKCRNSGCAEFSHGGNNAHHVGRRVKFRGGSFLNVSVLAVWVLVEASDKSEELEIGVGDLITTNVSSSIP